MQYNALPAIGKKGYRRKFLEHMGHRQMLGLHEPEQLQPNEEYNDNNHSEDRLQPKASVLGIR